MARRANQYFLFVFLFFMIGSTVLGLLLTNVMGLPSDWSNIIMQFLVLCKNGESLGEGMLFH